MARRLSDPDMRAHEQWPEGTASIVGAPMVEAASVVLNTG